MEIGALSFMLIRLIIVSVVRRTLIQIFHSLSLRLTGYGIHYCFARSVLEGSTSHLHYFALAGIAMASCLVLCPVVAAFGRRGGLLTFMIITALASLLQLGLLSCEHIYIHTRVSAYILY